MFAPFLFIWFTSTNVLLTGLLFSGAFMAGQIVLQPLLSAICTLFYYDQRVRKEGYDLELLARDMAPG